MIKNLPIIFSSYIGLHVIQRGKYVSRGLKTLSWNFTEEEGNSQDICRIHFLTFPGISEVNVWEFF